MKEAKTLALAHEIAEKISKSIKDKKSVPRRYIGAHDASRQHKHSIPALIFFLHFMLHEDNDEHTFQDTYVYIEDQIRELPNSLPITIKVYFLLRILIWISMILNQLNQVMDI